MKQVYFFFICVFALNSCLNSSGPREAKTTKLVDDDILFRVLDTDFSKGRLLHKQEIRMDDLVKFHGHLCDGLVVGALAFQTVMKELYAGQPIDRTQLRVISQTSPCLTDVGAYLSGGRYQFNSFYADPDLEGLFIIQKKDSEEIWSVGLLSGIKPTAIDSMGALAVRGDLSPCEIDSLRILEDKFTEELWRRPSEELFWVEHLDSFEWSSPLSDTYLKIDIVNKNAPLCK